MMANPVIESELKSFVAVAKRQGLICDSHADKIQTHAERSGMRPADVALELSMLQPHEVEAIERLRRPAELVPGYTLTALLGCGAGGMVFRARQEALKRDVALKTINPHSHTAPSTGESRLQREAHAIAKLRHPGIVAAYDSGFYQGQFCIAMELVEGETLAEHIERKRNLDEKTAWRIARQVACALSHAHDRGIIHRDIKPANLLLCEAPIGSTLPNGIPLVKVADFGLASLAEHSGQITATGATLGSPAYVAPEQLNDPSVDQRADIYSLGATVFQMLAGHPPCVDQSPMKTIMQKSIGVDRWREELDSVVSPGSLTLFHQMTEADPDERIPDYATCISRIDSLLESLDDDPRVSIAEQDRPYLAVRRNKSIAVAVVSSFLILLTSSVLLKSDEGGDVSDDGVAIPSQPAEIQWVADGFPQSLFNGNSVPLFRAAGTWTPTETGDGSRVLAGDEGAEMSIPFHLSRVPATDFRLRVAVNLAAHQDSQVEIEIVDSKSHRVAMLQLKRGQARLVNIKESLMTDSIATQTLFDSRNSDSVFQRLIFRRRGDTFSVTVNGHVVGAMHGDEIEGIQSVVLRCKTKGSSFADIDIVGLAPAEFIPSSS